MLKNGFLTFCCAFIPGAGQMYQGYMKRGLSLILMACCIGMVSSLLNPVMLLLVVVWMYSFFDTFNLRAQIIADTAPEDDRVGRAANRPSTSDFSVLKQVTNRMMVYPGPSAGHQSS